MRKKCESDTDHRNGHDTEATDSEGVEAVREPPFRDGFPFDALADHAEREYRAGRTRSLRDFAAAEGVTIDE